MVSQSVYVQVGLTVTTAGDYEQYQRCSNT